MAKKDITIFELAMIMMIDHGDHDDHGDHGDRYRAGGADCRKGRVITNQTPLVAIDGLQGVILMHLHITSS